MTGPRIPMLQRKPGAGGVPSAGGGGPKMPPLPLPSAATEGDPNAQAAAMAAAMDASPGAAAQAPDEPTGMGMTQCPVCGCAFDPKDPEGTATPPAGVGAGAPGGPPGLPPGAGGAGGGMPPELQAKLASIMGAGGGGGGGMR